MGYGFIRPDAGEPEVFFHATGCIDQSPKVGSRVAYRNGWDQKKQRPSAKGVRYETVEDQERRMGGRPAAVSSSAAAAGAPASSGPVARSAPASARETVSETFSSCTSSGEERGRVLNMNLSTAPCVDTGEEMQRLGRQGPKRRKEAVREAQETARKGTRERAWKRNTSQEQSGAVHEDPGVDDEQGASLGIRLGRGRE